MRSWRGSVCFALVVLAGLSRTVRADAQLLVVATPGDPPAIERAEVAYAEGAGTPMTWLSLRLQRGPAAVVAALPKDAKIEPALDAWFAALEATDSPNIVGPASTTNCGQTGSFVHVDWPRSAGVEATVLNVTTAEDAASALEQQGLKLDADLPAAERYVIWSWSAPSSEQTTRTLRLEGLNATLAFSPAAPFPVFVNTLTRGAMAVPAEQDSGGLRVTFVAGRQPTTDYREQLQNWVSTQPAALVETRARGPLFDWSIYGDAVSLPPLVRSYALGAARELSALDADACTDQLRALRDAGAPSATACGDATDASLALAAAGSEQPTLQRFVLSGTAGFTPNQLVGGGDPQTPVVIAQRLDDSACEPVALSPSPNPSPSPGPSKSGGDAPDPNGGTTVVVEETTVVDTDPTEVDCGSSAPGRDPGYDDNQSSGCSSDTSSSSESDSSDTSCSGDSSSSTDSSSDSGCSSDSSSSSSSDSTDSGCSSGSESSGYNGDTCTGNAAPGAEPAEKAQASLVSGVRRPHPQRLKTSLWSLGLAAALLPIRRRKRGQSASG